MDQSLIAWARKVKARRPSSQRHLPVLWLLSDATRVNKLAPVIAALPANLCGIVLRHDMDAAPVLKACRARRIPLVIANPAQAALHHTGLHLRRGRKPLVAAKILRTASAHTIPELRRAARNGAQIVFLSPVFPTASHPGQPVLGPVRWAALSRHASIPVFALGGLTGFTARRLPRWCAGAGAIGALAG